MLDLGELADSAERRRHDFGTVSGGERLLRALVIRGLSASALRAACLLCVELDQPPGADRIEPQREDARLLSRQRIRVGR
jgi:hypothetical protein